MQHKIRLSQLEKYMSLAQHQGKCLYIIAPAGSGKTQKIHQLAKKFFPKANEPLIDVRLGGKELPEITGQRIPTIYKDEDGKEHTKNTFIYADYIPEDDWEGVLLYDEFSHADSYIQKPMYQVLRDRMVEQKPLAKKALLMAAGNRTTDNGGTFELLSPLANDIMILELDTTSEEAFKEYIDYFIEAKFHPAVIAHLKKNPNELFTFEDRGDYQSFASPRSWERVSEVLYFAEENGWEKSEILPAVEGYVGNCAFSFIITYNLDRHIPDPEDILNAKETNLLHLEDINPAQREGLLYYTTEIVYQALHMKYYSDAYSEKDLVKYFANMFKFVGTAFEKDVEKYSSLFFRIHKNFLSHNTPKGKLICKDIIKNEAVSNMINKETTFNRVVQETLNAV